MKRLLACLALVLLLAVPVSIEPINSGWSLQVRSLNQIHDQLSSIHQPDVVIYHAIGNIFDRSFLEPFETLIFLTWQGMVYIYTNQLSDKVILPLEVVEIDLAFTGQDMSDVMLVVHNHFASPIFSSQGKQNDIKYYNLLRRHGFTGVFALWDTAQGKMVNRLPVKK